MNFCGTFWKWFSEPQSFGYIAILGISFIVVSRKNRLPGGNVTYFLVVSFFTFSSDGFCVVLQAMAHDRTRSVDENHTGVAHSLVCCQSRRRACGCGHERRILPRPENKVSISCPLWFSGCFVSLLHVQSKFSITNFITNLRIPFFR